MHLKNHFGDNLKLCYVDTDSYLVKIMGENPYDFIKDNNSLFDTSNYSVNNQHKIQLLNKKKVGLLKDELGGCQMNEFVGLLPKMIAFKTDNENDECKKAKGLGRNVIKKLTFEDYKSCLFQGEEYEPMYKKQKMIQSEDLQLYTVEVSKKTLSSKDDKRISIDDFETIPYGFNACN